MSSPILPHGRMRPAQSITTAPPGPPGAPPADLLCGQGIAIEAARGGPPPELLAQMAFASRAGERLRAEGRTLSFAGGDGTPARIELCDLEGTALRTLSVVEAIAIAAGRPAQ